MGAMGWAFVAAAGLAALPAWANGGAVQGDAPLQSAPAALIGGSRVGTIAVGGDLRIMLDLRAPSQGGRDERVAAPFRRRLSSAMIEFYPIGGEGLHLSAGSRFDMLAKAARGAPKLATLIYAPASQFGRGRRSLKRFAPAAAVGYGYSLAPGMTLNLEGGARVEPDDPAMREFARFARRGSRGFRRFDTDGGVNPVVQLSFGYRF